MSLMDFIQQPDVLRFLFALLSILTTLSTAFAYRAKRTADAAKAHSEAVRIEAETAKVDAQTAKIEAESQRNILHSIEIMAKAMSDNADNDRQERELRRMQIEQQNQAMTQIASNMSAFMQENVSGRGQAVKQVSDTLSAEIQANRDAIVGGFQNLETWLDAIAEGVEEMRLSLHKIVTLVQQPPALAPAPDTLQLPVPPPSTPPTDIQPNGDPPGLPKAS